MKQFLIILQFELKAYFKNKIFIGATIVLILLSAGVLFFPAFRQLISSGEKTGTKEEAPIMLLASETEELPADQIYAAFSEAFPDYQVQQADPDTEAVREKIRGEEAGCAVVLHSLGSYTYYVNNRSMYDLNTEMADRVLEKLGAMAALTEHGVDSTQAQSILAAPVLHETETLGTDQSNSFLYTYLMIMALYVVILLYGQMVATSVATEKSSRAMELLITSTKPVSMMFGKVIAACMAGLFQIIVVFGSAVLFYFLNQEHWKDSALIASIFDMPVSLLLYMLLFFVLGFFIYAFLFGAIGSLASKVEDINTSSLPLNLLFLISFMVVVFSLSGGTTDSMLLKVCSFIPFTSPMAMFTRIAMGAVPVIQILISVSILILTALGVGVLAAKIYRVGVLLYGTPPKPGAVFRALKHNRV